MENRSLTRTNTKRVEPGKRNSKALGRSLQTNANFHDAVHEKTLVPWPMKAGQLSAHADLKRLAGFTTVGYKANR